MPDSKYDTQGRPINSSIVKSSLSLKLILFIFIFSYIFRVYFNNKYMKSFGLILLFVVFYLIVLSLSKKNYSDFLQKINSEKQINDIFVQYDDESDFDSKKADKLIEEFNK